jgi:LysM domain
MAVVMEKPHPTLPPNYRPRGGIPYRVQNGDNWWSVADRLGMPVAALIRFNFNTQEPKHVNYYLKHNVGCKVVSPDGKNYSFRDASPGIIYVPGPGSGFVWASEPTKPIKPTPVDDEYTTIPWSGIEVRDVTETFGPKMAKLLRSDPHLRTLAFPRLHRPRMRGYSGADYADVARRIHLDGIEVYETRKDSGLGFFGKYDSHGGLNYFMLRPSVTATPLLYMTTLIHEATHAIQDRNKWRMSELDDEVDTHFAEALYLVRSRKEHEAKTDLRMTRFMIAAREYDADERYLTSIDFIKLRREMRHDVTEHYAFMNSIFAGPGFDREAWLKDFRRKKRWDGIPD